MARTIEQIKTAIIDSVNANMPGMSGSAVAEWRLWAYIVAVAIHYFEIIMDLFRREIDTLTAQITPGTVRWYAEMCKRFQNGDSLAFDEKTALLAYPTVNDAKRIIEVAAVSEGKDESNKLFIKVAKKDDAGNVVAGKLDTDGGASNLSAPTGLYWASVNTDKLTYSLEPITTLGVIGTFNGWGGDAEMTPDASHKVYTAEVNFPGDGEWKIRANNDWAISFGNSMENMTFNGGNLQDPGAGTYTVTFDLTTIPYTATCTK